MPTASCFVKVHREYATRVAQGTVGDDELDAVILAGFVLRHWEVHGHSPTMSQLCRMSRRGWQRTERGVDWLVRHEWLRVRKQPYKRPAAGDVYAAKWRFDVPAGSPLRQLADPVGEFSRTVTPPAAATGDTTAGAAVSPASRKVSPASSRVWIPMVAEAAQARSLTVPGCYLVLHEQMVVDQLIVTTPADMARALRCSAHAAAHAFRANGAVRVLDQGVHSAYVMDTPFQRKVSQASERIRGRTVYYLARDVEAQRTELSRLRSLLTRYGMDPDREERKAIDTLVAVGAVPTVPQLCALLEAEHMRIVARDGTLWARMVRSFAFRVRGAMRPVRARESREAGRTLARASAALRQLPDTTQPAPVLSDYAKAWIERGHELLRSGQPPP
jgi:hypothetical protein